MAKEREGIFVIQYKDYNGYKPYVTPSGLATLNIDDAEWFETRTKAYKTMLGLNLDKKCTVEEVKE